MVLTSACREGTLTPKSQHINNEDAMKLVVRVLVVAVVCVSVPKGSSASPISVGTSAVGTQGDTIILDWTMGFCRISPVGTTAAIKPCFQTGFYPVPDDLQLTVDGDATFIDFTLSGQAVSQDFVGLVEGSIEAYSPQDGTITAYWIFSILIQYFQGDVVDELRFSGSVVHNFEPDGPIANGSSDRRPLRYTSRFSAEDAPPGLITGIVQFSAPQVVHGDNVDKVTRATLQASIGNDKDIQNFSLHVAVEHVPEPTSLTLMAVAAGFGLVRRSARGRRFR
jgi:hypothetical protein